MHRASGQPVGNYDNWPWGRAGQGEHLGRGADWAGVGVFFFCNRLWAEFSCYHWLCTRIYLQDFIDSLQRHLVPHVFRAGAAGAGQLGGDAWERAAVPAERPVGSLVSQLCARAPQLR